jgi:MFS family permease
MVMLGLPPHQSRKILMSVAALLIAVGAALQLATGVAMALFSFSLCTIGVGIWACNLHALAADSFPGPIVATVHGTAGSAGAVGGIVFNSLVGYFGTRHQYGWALLMFALLLPAAVAPLWLWLDSPLPAESPELKPAEAAPRFP